MKKVFSYIFSASLIIFLLLEIVDICCFDNNFYKKEYTKLNTASEIGVTQESLDKMTDVVLGYLQNKYDSMDLQLEINGQIKEVFDLREKGHMVDVKELYQNAMFVKNLCFVLAVISISYLIKKFNKNEIKKSLKEAYLKSLLIFAFAFGLLGIYAACDFNNFWTQFHMIFFDNDLWLLDPSYEVLIMMVPEQFFFDLVMKIVLLFMICIILVYVVLRIGVKKHDTHSVV